MSFMQGLGFSTKVPKKIFSQLKGVLKKKETTSVTPEVSQEDIEFLKEWLNADIPTMSGVSPSDVVKNGKQVILNDITRDVKDKDIVLNKYFVGDDKTLQNILKIIFKLPSLTYLVIKENNLDALPKEISHSSLEDFELRDMNLLDKLPKEIGDLKKLKVFKLNRINLENLPESLGGLKNLEMLELTLRRLNNLPESLGGLEKLENLSILDSSLSQLPSFISGYSNLRTLKINNSFLEKLPESLGGLKNLKELHIHNSYIQEVPTSLSGLGNLESFTISNAGLQKVPEFFQNFKNLKTINLNNNLIKDFSANVFSVFGALEKLEYLNISHNPIGTLPNNMKLGKTSRYLKEINIRNTNIDKADIESVLSQNSYLQGNNILLSNEEKFGGLEDNQNTDFIKRKWITDIQKNTDKMPFLRIPDEMIPSSSRIEEVVREGAGIIQGGIGVVREGAGIIQGGIGVVREGVEVSQDKMPASLRK